MSDSAALVMNAGIKARRDADSHVDSHGGSTRSNQVDRVDDTRLPHARETLPANRMDAQHPDF